MTCPKYLVIKSRKSGSGVEYCSLSDDLFATHLGIALLLLLVLSHMIFLLSFSLLARAGSCKRDSDFDFSDSEEEDDHLCNTMLIVGKHGIGKTACVHALAQQLNYKVS